MGCAPSLPLSGHGGILRIRHSSSGSLALEASRNVAADNNGDLHSNHQNKGANSYETLSSGSAPNNQDGIGELETMKTRRDPLQILLLFAQDSQSDVWTWAARKLGHEVVLLTCWQREEIIKKTLDMKPNIVLIDRRNPGRSAEADALCSAIRTTIGGHPCVIVAVIKKSFLEREEPSVLQLLELGYDRVYPESGSLGTCLNELVVLESSELKWRQRSQMSESVLSAVKNMRDLVTITDEGANILYVNPAAEKLLGLSSQEIVGKAVTSLHNADHGRFDIGEAFNQAIGQDKDWEGTCLFRRKSGDTVLLHTRILLSPGTSASGATRQVTILQEMPNLFGEKSVTSDVATTDPFPFGRNSVHSARKASYDVRSLGNDATRRQSLAKLHSMAIEAPITKVINIITAAQESSPIYISQALDKVLEILKSTELYAPQVSDSKVKTDDPVTTDLLGALLMQGQRTFGYGRRSSSESTSKPHAALYTRPLLPSLTNISTPIQIRELLENDMNWDFDVIRLEKLTCHRPLVWLGMTVLTRFEVHRTLNCDEATLQNWLTLIEANYHAANSYHNSTHAADVLQATAYFLQKNRIKQLLDPLDEAASLIAAAVHDVDHPGKTSGFLCNSGNDLAILYNDLSVLESHHSALAFKLSLSDDRVNIFKGLDRESYKMLRQSVIDMVLATEMTKHFEHLSKFVNVFTKPFENDDPSIHEEMDYQTLATTENITLVKRMLIKCADVSNPTRPLALCVEWAKRIAEEYFTQTAEEKAKGLPVVMPQFDRTTCSIPKSQIGFTDYFIIDMFEAWDDFAETPELIEHMQRNYYFWKEQDALGVTGIPSEFTSSLSPTEGTLRKTEFETLTEAKETQDP